MKEEFLSIQSAAEFLGVSPTTLRRWEEKGVLIPERTFGNQRRYALSVLKTFNKKDHSLIENPLQPEPEDPKNQNADKILLSHQEEKPILQEYLFTSPTNIPVEPFFTKTQSKPQLPGSAAEPLTSNEQQAAALINKAKRKGNFFKNNPKTATGLLLITCFVLIFTAFSLQSGEKNDNKMQTQNGKSVLGLEAKGRHLIGDVLFSIPAIFDEKVTINNQFEVNGKSLFTEDIEVANKNVDLGTGKLTASNVVYTITAGANVSISGDPQNPTISANLDIPNAVVSFQGQSGNVTLAEGDGIGLDGLTISNTGVLSLGGETGDVELTAGDGIEVDGATITNTDTGSAQNIFKEFIIDGSSILAESNSDVFTFEAGSGIVLTPDTTTKKLTITSNASGTLAGLSTNGVLYATDSTNATSTSPGTTGTVLKGVTGGAPVFGAVTLSADVTGTLPIGNGGTGVTGTPSNGQLLIGNGSGYTIATMTQGSGIGISNGAGTITVTNNGVLSLTGTANQVNVSGATGSITLSLPQSIHTGATPTFASMTLSSNTNQLILGTGNTGTITMGTLTTGQTYTLPNQSGEICVSTGNCPGGGGGTIGGTGTTNYLAKFTGATDIGNSLLYDTGQKIGIGTLSPQGLFSVSGASTGSALISLNETGDQAILTASRAGVTKFTINNNGNLQFAGNTNFTNTLTSLATQNQTYTLPDATGTICLTTGNCAGAGGEIIGSGTNGQIAYFTGSGTVTSESSGFFWDAANNRLGIGNDSPASKLDLTGFVTGKSLLTLNETGGNDIFTASASGVTRLSLSNNGNLNLIGGVYQSGGVSGITQGSASCVTTTGGIVTGFGACQLGSEQWIVNNGAIYTGVQTLDLLLGGNSTTSAKFAVTNMAGGTPTATISAGTANNAAFLTGAGTLGTTNAQTLQLGSSSTGNVHLTPGGTNVISGFANGNLTLGSNTSNAATILQAGTGNISLVTHAAAGVTGAISIQSGDSSTSTAGNVVIDTGTGILSGTPVIERTFEGSGTGSTEDFASWYSSSIAASNTQAHGGSYSMLVTESAAAWGVAQACCSSIPVTPGNQYIISAWVRAGTTPETIMSRVTWNGGSFNNTSTSLPSVTTSTTGWTQISGAVVAPSGVSHMYFTFNSADGANGQETYFDDLTVTNVSNVSAPAVNIATTNAQRVTIGNTNQAGLTALYGGANGISLTAGTNAAITIGTSNANTVTVGNTGSGILTLQSSGITQTFNGSGSILQSLTNASNAFSVANTAGSGVFTIGTTGTSPVATVAANTTFAGVVIDQAGTGDIFTASASGTTRLTLSNGGNLNLTSGVYQSGGVSGITQGSASCVTTTGGIVTGIGSCQAGSELWQVSNGSIYTGIQSLDLLLGGTSTASARFAVLNMAGGTPTASISAGTTNNAAFLTGTGNLGTTNAQTLTLGGASTGDINFAPHGANLLRLSTQQTGGNVSIGTSPLQDWAELSIGAVAGQNSDILLRDGDGTNTWDIFADIDGSFGVYDVTNGKTPFAIDPNTPTDTLTLNASGGVGIGNANPTAILDVNGSSAGKALTILNETGGNDIFTASASGATKFTLLNSGTIRMANYTTAGGIFYGTSTGDLALSTAGSGGECLVSGGTGAPTWGACGGGSSTNYWNLANGLLYNGNTTTDFAVGGNSTTSAKFLVTMSGTRPTASVSANTADAALLVDNRGAGDLFTASSSGFNRFVIKQNGNIGIDNGSPTQKLQVDSGNILVRGTGNFGILGDRASLFLGDTSNAISAIANTGVTLSAFFAPDALTVQNLTGNVGIGTTNPVAKLDIRGNSGTTPIASFSGQTTNASVVVDQSGTGDLFSASKSGATKFTIQNSGNISLANYNNCGMLTTTGTVLTCSAVPGGISQYWRTSPSGTFSFMNDTMDFLFGGNATSSAKFKLSPSGTGPTALVSANTSHAALTVNNIGNGDLFSASSSGTPVFIVDTNGNLGIGSETSVISAIQVGKKYIPDTGITAPKYITVEEFSTHSNFANGTASYVGNWYNYGHWGIGTGTNGADNTVRLGVITDSTNSFDSAQNIKLIMGGTLGQSAKATLDIRTTFATLPAASFSGSTTFAAQVVDQSGSGDIFAASKSGATKFVIKNNGYVGIGTNAPTTNLEIAGARPLTFDAATGSIYVKGDTSGWSTGFNAYGSSGTDRGGFNFYGTADTLQYYYLGTGGGFNNPLLNVLPNGSVGIGIPNANLNDPLATFDVRGKLGIAPVASFSGQTAKAALVVDNNGFGDLFTASKSGATKFVVNNNGNVGINTRSAESLLDLTTTDDNQGLRLYNSNRTKYISISDDTANVVVTASGQNFIINSDAYLSSANLFMGGNTIYGEQAFAGGNLFLDSTSSSTKGNIILNPSGGNVGIGLSANLLATLDVRGTSGVTPVASIAGITSKAALHVDNSGLGDIFTASKSGATKFVIKNNGDLRATNYNTAGGVFYGSTDGTLRITAQGTSGECLQSTGVGGAPTWGACGAASPTNHWTIANGLLYNGNTTTDFAVGGISTTSAKFLVSMSGTRPTASVSANTSSAGLVVDNNGVGDLFTASKSGKTHFVIRNSGTVVIGNSTDGLTFDPQNGGPSYAGNARPTKTISLQPEYSGAVLTAFYGAGTDTNITGNLTSDVETSGTNNLRSYYQWERTTDATQHFYTVAVRVRLPKDFSAWTSSNAIQVDYITESATSTNSDLDVRVYIENDASMASTDAESLNNTSTSWSTIGIAGSSLTEVDAADETAVIYLRMGSASSNFVKIGEIRLNYLSRF